MDNKLPAPLIQNHQSWCWVVCAKIAGNIYKNKYPPFDFDLSILEKQYPFGIPIEDITSFRSGFLGTLEGQWTVDLWQWMISKAVPCQYQNTANDIEKARAIKFVTTGDINSTQIEVACVGKFGSGISLAPFFNDVLADYLADRGCIIGNYYAIEKNSFHSVVIIGNGRGLELYDPWNGNTWPVTADQLFTDGFYTNFGHGIIEWIFLC